LLLLLLLLLPLLTVIAAAPPAVLAAVLLLLLLYLLLPAAAHLWLRYAQALQSPTLQDSTQAHVIVALQSLSAACNHAMMQLAEAEPSNTCVFRRCCVKVGGLQSDLPVQRVLSAASLSAENG
jgi:uncharacterized membrane protein